MAWLPKGPGPAFLMLLLLLLSACRSPTSDESEKATAVDPAYGNLDPFARDMAEDALQKTLEGLPSGSTRSWNVDGTGISGSVTPLRTFRIKSGHFCREFRESVSRNSDVVTRVEVACRKPEGGWVVDPRREQQS